MSSLGFKMLVHIYECGSVSIYFREINAISNVWQNFYEHFVEAGQAEDNRSFRPPWTVSRLLER